MERTLVILKPDAVRRKLLGEIIARFERRNLDITCMKMMQLDAAAVEAHYSHIMALPIYRDMVGYMTSGPAVVLIVEGEKAVQTVRGMVGKTSSFDSTPGTIRGDYGLHTYENLVHASDSVENAEIEIKRFFN